MIKCSVLMPVYNGELYLKEAIDSILSQTFTDFEFIIVNDGSTDRSEEIILSYQDSRIKYYKNETNLRLIKTLNKGLDLCKGEFIVRMDADDIALPTKFEKQIDILSSNSNIIACGTQITRFGLSRRKKNKVSWIRESSKQIKAQLFKSNCFAHPTVMMRSYILRNNNIKYQDSYLHVEDYKFWYDLSKFGEFYNIQESLLMYRLSDNQISTKHNDFQKTSVLSLQKEIINDFLLSFSSSVKLLTFKSEKEISEIINIEKEYSSEEYTHLFTSILTSLYLIHKPGIKYFILNKLYLRKGFTMSDFVKIIKCNLK